MKPWQILLLWNVGLWLPLMAGEAIPGATASDWLVDPQAAAKAAGAAASKTAEYGASVWAAIGLTTLAVLRMATPVIARLVPVWGTLVEGTANVAWAAMATKKQKEADNASEVAKSAAGYLIAIAEAARSMPPDALPENVRQLATSPIVAAAIEQLKANK